MATDEQIVSEVVEKYQDYETSMTTILQETNEIADKFRQIAGTRRSDQKGLSNTVVSEMAGQVETLATFWWKQQQAEFPNFHLAPTALGVSTDDIRRHTALLSEQNRVKEYKAQSLTGLRTLSLFGSLFIDEPYTVSEDGLIEYTDFIPKGLLEVAFDRTVQDIRRANWIAPSYFVNATSLRRMAAEDRSESVWRRAAVDAAVAGAQTTENIPARVRERLQSAGYVGTAHKGVLELILYQGILDANDDFKDMVVGVVNRKHLVRIHENKLPHRRKMTRYIGLKKFELEPLGYGVGREGLRIQKDLDANRNRIQDLITFSLLSMWKVARRANLDYSQMTISPWGIVEMDDPGSMEAIRPDVNAAQYGIQLEKMLKEDFQRLTGATDNLQATISDATAREVILAMNNAVRKVSVYGEVIADAMLGQHYERAVKNNQAFFDMEMWLHWTGSDAPVEILPVSIKKPMRAELRIITDRDFTPTRVTRMLTFLQHLTSIRNMIPQDEFNIVPVIEELGLALGIDPARLRRQAGEPRFSPERMIGLENSLREAVRSATPGERVTPAIQTSPVAEMPASVPLPEL